MGLHIKQDIAKIKQSQQDSPKDGTTFYFFLCCPYPIPQQTESDNHSQYENQQHREGIRRFLVKRYFFEQYIDNTQAQKNGQRIYPLLRRRHGFRLLAPSDGEYNGQQPDGNTNQLAFSDAFVENEKRRQQRHEKR